MNTNSVPTTVAR